MRGEPLKLVDGGQSQRTFVYIKDAIEAVLRMIVSTSGSILLRINLEVEHERLVSRVFFFICLVLKGQCRLHKLLLNICVFQENPARANGHIFNVGNPHNELTVRELAELMTDVSACRSPTPGVCTVLLWLLFLLQTCNFCTGVAEQVYCKVSGNPRPAVPTIDVTSMEFYGQGYDDSDKRIPDMTIIKKQLGTKSTQLILSLLVEKYQLLVGGEIPVT
jgi:UDP-apiose/xylose synthase